MSRNDIAGHLISAIQRNPELYNVINSPGRFYLITRDKAPIKKWYFGGLRMRCSNC